jgi:glycosyltransferase involved in cell wall biosynthesis
MNGLSDKISIIMPTYNGEKYLRKAIDTSLSQTYKNIELVIVNDGSKDQTAEIIKSYSDERIKYIKHEVNSGLPKALNTGFNNASGEYLTWTSDDNFYAPEAIEVLSNFLVDHPEIDFVYSNYYLIDENDVVSGIKEVEPTDILKYRNCIGPCFMYKKRVFETVGDFNPDVFLAEDYEYWLRVYKRFKMQSIPQALYYYRYHSNSLTAKYEERVRKITNKVRRNMLLKDFAINKKLRSELYMSAVFDDYATGDLSLVRRNIRNIFLGISNDPSWLKKRNVVFILMECFIGKKIMAQIKTLKKQIFN